MNTIARDQDSPLFQRVLKARQKIYADATVLQVTQFLATVLLPVAGAILGTLYSPARPYVALYGLIVAALDVLWLDRSLRGKLKAAAKIGEDFDCGVLKMPWNGFAAGRRVDEEKIDVASRNWRGDEARLRGWYGAIPEGAPLPLARVVCQRTNLWYDMSLRRSYRNLLICCAVVVFLGLIVGSAAMKLTMLDFVAVAATAAPALLWVVREQFRQSDAADAGETLKSDAERLFDEVKSGICSEAECEGRSREFQDAIFGRRVANPLIFLLVYRFMRPEMEKQMEAGADALLKDYTSPKAEMTGVH
jgi:hypothetical protein